MKYITIIFIALFFLVAGLVMSQKIKAVPERTPVQADPRGENEPPLVTVPQEKVNLPYPVKISIPAINVSADIEDVGLDDRQRMDVPKDFNNVGWYKLGYFPGERGSVVMAGHVDTKEGAPAVFSDVNKLKEGDEIIVKDSIDKTYKYIVVDKQLFPYDKVPLFTVFGANDYERLNLITCSGAFDEGKNNYSERLVVYAVKDDDLPEYRQ